VESIQSSEVKYECKVCKGTGEVDIGWNFSLIIKCGNCSGTGLCDWINNVIPKRFDQETGNWK